MPVALDRRVAYFGERLSNNLARTPDGYLICRNAVIARTGFQTYKVSELADPEGELAERYSPNDTIEVWRDPAEVFSPATIASFEGKTFTLTHPPDELLNPQNDNRHSRGHAQNVHRGTEPLTTGDWPLLADIIVKDEEAIRAIESGERELSCGYTYRLAREGYRWDQREIVGNHIALVQKGRAGEEARINDAASELPRRRAYVKNYFKDIFGQGLKAFAKDAAPEEVTDLLHDAGIAAATQAASQEPKPRAEVISIATDNKTEDKDAAPKMRYLGVTKEGKKIWEEVVDGSRSERREARDNTKDDKEAENRTADRKAILDKVNKVLDAVDGKSTAEDGDIADLKKSLDAYLSGKDDEHPKGCRCDDCMDKRKGKDKETEKELAEEDEEMTDEEKEEKEKKAEDDAEIVRAEPVLAANEVPKNALDAETLNVFMADSNLKVLRLFKPFIAKSGDKKLKAAYDTITNSLHKIVKDGTDGGGSYADFLKSAQTLGKHAKDSKETFQMHKSPTELATEEADKIYANVMKETGYPSKKFIAAN